MANEQLNLWNRALGLIGAPRIVSDTETSSSKTLVDDHWPGVRKEFICEHPWDGCSDWADLVANVTVSVPDRWNHAYDLPTDFLQLWAVNQLTDGYDSEPDHEILTLRGESPPVSILFTDVSPTKVFYSWDLDSDTDLALLAAIPTSALAYGLAVAMARPWGKKEVDVRQLRQEYDQKLSAARTANGHQQRNKRRLRSPLRDARDARWF